MSERIIQQLCVSVSEHRQLPGKTHSRFTAKSGQDALQGLPEVFVCESVCLSVYVCVSVCLSVCSHPRSFYNDVIVRLATVSLMKRAVCVFLCVSVCVQS